MGARRAGMCLGRARRRVVSRRGETRDVRMRKSDLRKSVSHLDPVECDVAVEIFYDISRLPSYGPPFRKRHSYGLQSQKTDKNTPDRRRDFFKRRGRRRFFRAGGFAFEKVSDREGGGCSSLRATVLWGASLHSLTSSHLHALGEYRPHAIRVLTCRLTCADLSSRAFSNYPL